MGRQLEVSGEHIFEAERIPDHFNPLQEWLTNKDHSKSKVYNSDVM